MVVKKKMEKYIEKKSVYKEYIDMDFKCLYTDRLIIRRLKLSDKEDFFKYRSHRNVITYQSWKPKNIQEIEDFIKSMNEIHPNIPGTWFQMAVCIKETDKMIGDVGLHFFETNFLESEIGYTVSPDFQGKGYGIEAVRGILNYLFKKLGKHRVFASVDPENKPSIALLKKSGMRKEAHFRKNLFIDGEWLDECIYAILDEEWRAAR